MMLLLILFSPLLLAQDPYVRFTRIIEGLSQVTVYCAYQDSLGFMWFGTQDGLNRYDGYRFTVYKHDIKDPNSLSGNWIKVLYTDRVGNLWIGTTQGLNRYDHELGVFIRYRHDPEDPQSIGHDTINAIFETRDGQLWIGTEGGLDEIDPGSMKVVHHQHTTPDPGEPAQDPVLTVYEDRGGDLWVGSSRGLKRFDRAEQRWRRFSMENPKLAWVSAIFEDRSGILWIGTENGLHRMDPDRKKIEPVSLTRGTGPDQEKIETIFEDSAQRLWIGTDNGLYRYHKNRNRLSVYRTSANDFSSLSDNHINELYADRTGVLWIGTNNGLSKFDPGSELFLCFKADSSDPDSLSNNEVWSFFEDRRGFLWIGTTKGLNELDPITGHYKKYLNDPEDPRSLSHSGVGAICEDRLGRLWVGTDDGLNLLDRQTGNFQRFMHDPEDPQSFSRGAVTSILEDSKGQIWIGTNRGGLTLMDTEPISFKHYRYAHEKPDGLAHNEVWIIFEDTRGKLWIGTSGGLELHDPISESFTHYRHHPDINYSLSNNGVGTIGEDIKGRLWVGTDSGLNMLETGQNRFVRYGTKEGLPGEFLHGILNDDQGFLWISTNMGLARLDPITGTFQSYTTEHGLQNNEFSNGSYFKSRNGQLFFGGITGYNTFFPDQIQNDPHVPEVVLTDFFLLNQPVQPHTKDSPSPLLKRIESTSRLELYYTDYLVGFEFAGLHFASPARNRYAYKLEGFDSDWNFTDANQRKAIYTKIPHGSYVFRVKAGNRDGVWNEKGVSLELTVHPPIWKSWWAYGLYVTVLAGVIISLVRSQRQKLAFQHAVNQKLIQMDRVKDEFLANTSHELRTPLNGIIGLIESLIDGVAGKLPEQALFNLSLVLSTSNRLSHLINDLLDFSKLKHKTLFLRSGVVDLHSLTDVVLLHCRPLAGHKKLELVNAVSPEIYKVEADESKLQQIMYNLVGNAVKFTNSGRIEVSAMVSGENLLVRVSDTGIGIPKDKLPAIFESFEQVDGSLERTHGGTGLGLAITRQLILLHGGSIDVDSTVGKGSTFSFTLPISDHQTTTVPIKSHGPITLEHPSSAHSRDKDPDTTPVLGKGAHILIVDDDPVNRQVLINHLASGDYRITQTTGGSEALEAIRKLGHVDLVLLDVMMPGMSGYKVCKILRETYSFHELPVIMLTAKNQPLDIVAGFESGANDYLAKPFSRQELMARLKMHLRLLDINRNLENKIQVRTEHLTQALQKAKEARQAAENANQAKSTFLSTMSHEIRTPMSGVIGMTALLSETGLTEEQVELVEIIRESGNVLLSLIDDILDFSKIEAGKLHLKEQKFDLRACIESTIDLLATKAIEKNLDLVYDMTAGVPEFIYGDNTRLRQILINLLGNALKFTEKGEIELRVEARALERFSAQRKMKPEDSETPIGGPRIETNADEARAFELHFYVKDTGVGIPNDKQHLLFQSFSQVDYTPNRKYGGTGLGLAICKHLVEKMNGNIQIESRKGEGSCFHFTITATMAEAPCRPFLEEAPPALKGKRILLLEDGDANRRFIAGLLERWGCVVRQSDKARHSLDWVRTGARFDAILVDWQLPEEDMIQLVEEIKRHIPKVSIIILTHLALKIKNHLHGSSKVAKPVKPAQLFEKLKEAFAKPGDGGSREGQAITMLDPGLSIRFPLRILVAEDNVVNQKLAIRMLSRLGYQVDLAVNGLEAVEAFKSQSYDLVLMDIQMPEMDGLEAAHYIRTHFQDREQPTIIAISANILPEDQKTCLAAGMDGFIPKPLKIGQLVDVLKRYG